MLERPPHMILTHFSPYTARQYNSGYHVSPFVPSGVL